MAVTKYFDGGYSGQVTVQKSSSRFAADCKLHLDSGVILHAAGEAMDPQLAFDAAQMRIEKRLRRYKRRLKDHHATNPADDAFGEVAYTVMNGMSDEDHEVADDFAPAIIAESSKQLKTMSVANAVMALDMTDEPMLMFRSTGKELNIVYRRHDGNIGWIDAASIKG